jgi:hypothetical protein
LEEGRGGKRVVFVSDCLETMMMMKGDAIDEVEEKR